MKTQILLILSLSGPIHGRHLALGHYHFHSRSASSDALQFRTQSGVLRQPLNNPHIYDIQTFCFKGSELRKSAMVTGGCGAGGHDYDTYFNISHSV